MDRHDAAPTELQNARDAYFRAIMAGERSQALEIASGLVHRGFPAVDILQGVLAPAQNAVGEAWQRNEASVTQEHRASAITEYAVGAVVDEALMLPGAPRAGAVGSTMIVCSEGEWHVLHARIAEAVLRLEGLDVTLIGPSTPADDLAEFLRNDPPRAVAVTCMMQLSLVGAWKSISALRGVGTHIVAGGRGFGPEGAWGLAIGADTSARDFLTGAQDIVSALHRDPPQPRDPAGSPEVIAEVSRLYNDLERTVEEAMGLAIERWPMLHDVPQAMRATREDLVSTAKALASSTLVGDPGVLTDYVRWFESVLGARSLPVGLVASAFDLLLGALPPDLPLLRAGAEQGLGLCSAPPMAAGDRLV